MSFEPTILFPGPLADSVAKWARDVASAPSERPSPAIIRDMGWSAVLVPESHGGAGGGIGDLAAIVEGLASHGVDLPVMTRCGVVPTLLMALSDTPAAGALLRDIAAGTAVVELGGPLCDSEATPPLSARAHAGDWRLSGETAEAVLSEDCTHVLLACRNATDGQWMLAAIDADALRAHAAGYRTMDDRRVAFARLEDAVLPADRVLAIGPAARRAIQAGWRMAVAAAATDTVCAMGSALARTIAYLLERRQFGQSLAQFQALRHDVARLYIVYETARHLLQASLRDWDADAGQNADAGATALLGLYAGQQAIPFAESVIQLHGGMGMTREMPAAQLATRLLANAFRFGDPLGHRHALHALRTGTPS